MMPADVGQQGMCDSSSDVWTASALLMTGVLCCNTSNVPGRCVGFTAEIFTCMQIDNQL